jgi:hypothetical protein
MPYAPIAQRAAASALAVVMTFGLMRTLDIAAVQHRQQVLAALADAQSVQRVHIVGARPPRS